MKLYVKLALSFGGNSPTDGRFRNIQHILNKVNESSAVIASQCMPSIVDIEEVNTLMSDFRVAEIQHLYSTEDSVSHGWGCETVYDEGQELHKQYTALHRSFMALSRQNKAEEAVALLNGKALEKIVTMADGTADLVRALVTASKQQSASSEEINQSIAQLNTIADETSALPKLRNISLGRRHG